MASVNNPGRRVQGTLLDYVLKGVQVAGDLYGIKQRGDIAEQESTDRGSALKAATEDRQSALKAATEDRSALREATAADRAEQRKLTAASQALTASGQAETKRHNEATEKNQGAAIAARGKGGKGGAAAGPKLGRVPAQMASTVGTYDAAQKQLDVLEASYASRASGLGSSLKSYIKGTDANMFDKQADMSAQAIGQILEGGKLTETDLNNYKSMMPRASDTDDLAADKIVNLRRIIAEKKAGAISGFKQAGYDVAGFDGSTPIAPTGDGESGGFEDTATAAAPPKGKIWVSNGKEMREIDPSDLADAKKDNFLPVAGASGSWK